MVGSMVVYEYRNRNEFTILIHSPIPILNLSNLWTPRHSLLELLLAEFQL